ncbi:DoxX-like family protein [Elizabethkingia meningoseptica]|uniref:DoxX-like family protein n=1 Tax=Elizabethkingia meningoseptica TaxID=238 RepID=UPI002011F9C6|nr:DoxX-like family protein [Elizabethkingia meningoseptica]EJK5330110.1 DoxX-like family protein [Elizabethkingia meningoseptica]MCL1674554.1 DoxX-like family protein [Elizabethkingia meningoseptica]MCL1686247.1 DoxX-like family protein [Elizabethkingia meningoseptica]MDE5437549.1 DoxX-like family protein [Elizabethkingia meningoseptica]MDE5491082.1 DoxX-like family protein [Elizabethkingia meningoseptica]
MKKKNLHKIISYSIAAVWLVNGLFCKVLDFVPRHREIVANIIGHEYSKSLTIIIGFAEILMAVWILTGWKSRLNAITQSIVIATMNIMEFILVPHLLLWGRFNIVFASMLIVLIIYNEFVLSETPEHTVS